MGWFGRATIIAAAVWGAHPGGCQQVYHEWVPLRTVVIGEAWVGSCMIDYNRRRRYGWGKFCTVTIHEWGHLAGYRDWRNTLDPYHSVNPQSVMYFRFTHVDRRCRV